ncbi:MAG: DUF362 domain-containing protein [Planctomycetia bacterium]|nr:DUF362 domain-containing protein [Planctomycetia bacterium]
MERKEFLKTLALGGAAASLDLCASDPLLAAEQYDIIAVRGDDPAAMIRAGMAPLGGMESFIKKGETVVLKPNIGWDKTPDLAGDTNPELVGEMVKMCLEAGAKEVQVFDHTCDSLWRNCYQNSGIEAAVEAAGGRMVQGNDEGFYQEVALPKAKNLKTAKIHKAILDCDVWFNIPILKNHGGAKMTLAMKNLMGIVWDRRWFHSHNLHQCIADICTFEKKPALNIIDAFRVMKSNGPRGKSLADVVDAKTLLIGKNFVAIDTAAVKFFNQIEPMSLQAVGNIAFGEELDLGSSDLSGLKIKRIKL